MTSDVLLQARDCYARKAWGAAHASYTTAAAAAALDLDDLERFASVAHLLGREEESRDILAQGYRESLRTGVSARAARFAFWVGHSLIFESRMGEASGWITRARQLLAGLDGECAEHGYLVFWSGLEQI